MDAFEDLELDTRSPHLGILPRFIRPAGAGGYALYRQLFPKQRPSGPSYCQALAGESNYNICINSDRTVSCNCADYDGSGRIGDLQDQSWEEIFSSEKVHSFQAALFRGEYPIARCRDCPECMLIGAEQGVPMACKPPHRGIMIENTVACNLACALCDRTALFAHRRQVSLTENDYQSIAQLLEEFPVDQIYFFGLGEPFTSSRINEELAFLRTTSPHSYLVISTNGQLLDHRGGFDGALKCDHLFVSIDGVDQDTLERYQRKGDFERAFQNMKELIHRRGDRRHPFVEWKYVLFRWNDKPEHISKALALAEEAGADRVTFVPGTAGVRDMSLRYYSDTTLARGIPTSAGVSFDLTSDRTLT